MQSRRDRAAAKRLMRRLLKRHGCARVIVTDKLRSYAATHRDLGLSAEHRQHKGLNNRAENSHQPRRVRETVKHRFKSARQLQRFASVHGQVSNLFMACRYHRNADRKRTVRTRPLRLGNGLPLPAWRHNERRFLPRCLGRFQLNNLTIPP
ncbi:transposase [Pandoraea sputorum]|uniref:Transposase n=1 Tax=Pandoraea sputorum TaxID=93222 RepID=A0A5E5BKL0_9BURK|nr:transposase [Pandoraea sputorum]